MAINMSLQEQKQTLKRKHNTPATSTITTTTSKVNINNKQQPQQHQPQINMMLLQPQQSQTSSTFYSGGPTAQSGSTGSLYRRIRTPHEHDVLSGRGGGINAHAGNVQFREWVRVRKNEYNLAPTKSEKTRVAQQVIDLVREQNPPGRFLQKETSPSGWWVELDDDRVMAKTSQALREGAPQIRAAHSQSATISSAATRTTKSRRKVTRKRDTPEPNEPSAAAAVTFEGIGVPSSASSPPPSGPALMSSAHPSSSKAVFPPPSRPLPHQKPLLNLQPHDAIQQLHADALEALNQHDEQDEEGTKEHADTDTLAAEPVEPCFDDLGHHLCHPSRFEHLSGGPQEQSQPDVATAVEAVLRRHLDHPSEFEHGQEESQQQSQPNVVTAVDVVQDDSPRANKRVRVAYNGYALRPTDESPPLHGINHTSGTFPPMLDLSLIPSPRGMADRSHSLALGGEEDSDWNNQEFVNPFEHEDFSTFRPLIPAPSPNRNAPPRRDSSDSDVGGSASLIPPRVGILHRETSASSDMAGLGALLETTNNTSAAAGHTKSNQLNDKSGVRSSIRRVATPDLLDHPDTDHDPEVEDAAGDGEEKDETGFVFSMDEVYRATYHDYCHDQNHQAKRCNYDEDPWFPHVSDSHSR